jgi:hypothetical protein
MQIVPAINVFIEHGVFDTVPVEGEIAIADLASKVGIDASILSPCLPYLTAARRTDFA